MKHSQPIFLAILSAFLLSLPWLGYFPAWVLLAALIPLFIMEEQLHQENSNNPFLFFNYAFLTFYLWHVLTVWWVLKITIPGILLLSVLNSSCMALIWWLFHLMKKRFTPQFSLLALFSIWLSFEYLHHHWEIEWPWLNLGNGLASQYKIIQWYEYTGILGGTAWILMSNMLLFSIYKKVRVTGFPGVVRSILIWLMLAFLPIGWSLHRYSHYKEKGIDIEIVLLQPNVDPFTEKFTGLSPGEQYMRLINLSDSLISPQTVYVIGPETCLPEITEEPSISENSFVLPFRERARRHSNLKFIMGAMTRKDFSNDGHKPEAARLDTGKNCWFELYNSALQINSSRSIQIYHKSILVAGVEKMPFQHSFSFLKRHSLNLGGTSGSLGIQDSPSVLKSESVTVAPVICFESLFGEYIGKFVKKGAQLVVVMTNDGWLKSSSGYRQHLDISRIRAIETRRSIARSANTGISAFINQRGDILEQSNWSQTTGLRNTLKTNNGLTFYVRFGDYIGRISAFVGCLLLLYFIAQSHIPTKK